MIEDDAFPVMANIAGTLHSGSGQGEIMGGKKRDVKTAGAAKSANAADATDKPTEMVFESQDFRTIPAGVKQVLLKIARAGNDQSASLGAAVFEQLTPQSQFVIIAKQEIDNLADTPEKSFLAIAPKPGASYVITFVGEMHALSLAKAPLTLKLLVNAEGVGAAIEDFGGERVVDDRFAPIRGRALLRA